MEYIALLRGINVGGNSKVEMGKLKKVLEEMGLKNVKTILNSGNVVFKDGGSNLEKRIEQTLESSFGFPISLILLERKKLVSLIESTPFRGVNAKPNTRLTVSFLKNSPKINFKTPYSRENFKIIKAGEEMILSVVEINNQGGTPQLMKFLHKEFGKEITTRTWDTLVKISKR